MQINSIYNSPSFGTRIIIQDMNKLRNKVNGQFSYLCRRKFTEPMCDFWASVNEMPTSLVSRPKRAVVLKLDKPKKYTYLKQIFGATNEIDICTGGIVIGNNNKIAMFHIAPTLENYDNLSPDVSVFGDCFGKSIDAFSNKSGGIKRAIIVGGKKCSPNTSKADNERGEFSTKINSFIRKRFDDRSIKTTILSDFKKYVCDLFYHTGDDTLEIGTSLPVKKGDINEIFGEIKLQSNDSLSILE